MLKWFSLALGLGWAASTVYEWAWSGGSLGHYITWAVVGVTLALGLFMSIVTWEHRTGRPADMRPMSWFLLAATVAALFYSMLEHVAKNELTHVPMLPMYIVLFADFMGSGLYLLWKKSLKKK